MISARVAADPEGGSLMKRFILLAMAMTLANAASRGDGTAADPLPRPKKWDEGAACGPNALYCLLRIRQSEADYDQILENTAPRAEGSSLEDLRREARRWGLRTTVYQANRANFDKVERRLSES